MKINENKFHIAILTLLVIITYGNIIHNELVFDDHDFIEEWAEIKDFSHLKELLQGSTPNDHAGVYRPIRSIFYTIAYHFFDENPIGYHFLAILIHLIATIMFYVIIKKISQKTIALMSAALFAVHPIHTEAITFITASFDMIGAVLFLIAFYFYLRYNETLKIKWFILSIFCGITAFFTYEMTLVLPLILLAYEWIYSKINKQKIKQISPYIMGVALYLLMKFVIIQTHLRGTYFAKSIFFTTITMIKVIGKYILLLFIPYPLTIEHKIAPGIFSTQTPIAQMDSITNQHLFEMNVLITLIAIIVLTILFFISKKGKKEAAFGIIFFFIALLPILNIIPNKTLLAERYLYLASIGFCLCCAYFTYILAQRYPKRSKIIYSFFTVLLLLFSFIAYERNKDWKNDEALWQSTIQTTKESAMAYNNLGYIYQQKNKTNESAAYYEQAIALSADYSTAQNNLASIYLEQKNYTKAVIHLQAAIESNPANDIAYYNLAQAYQQMKSYERSKEVYEKVIILNPDYAKAYFNLATIYAINESYDKSLEYYSRAIEIQDDYAQAYYNSALVNLKLNDTSSAINNLQSTLEYDPENIKAKALLNEIKKNKRE